MPESTSEPRSAFKGGLKPFESAPEYARNSIFILEANPEKVVRRADQTDLPHAYFLEISKKSRELTKELESKYGIAVLDYEIVQAEDVEERKPAVYLVTDKLHGFNIDWDIPANIIEDNLNSFDGFFATLTSYLCDKYTNGGEMLTDIDPSQFMWGHTAKDPNDKIYLVDLDPWLDAIEPSGQNHEQQDLIFSGLHTIYKNMQNLEHTSGLEFRKTRENMLTRLQSIPSSIGYYTKSIQPILEDLQKAA